MLKLINDDIHLHITTIIIIYHYPITSNSFIFKLLKCSNDKRNSCGCSSSSNSSSGSSSGSGSCSNGSSSNGMRNRNRTDQKMRQADAFSMSTVIDELLSNLPH